MLDTKDLSTLEAICRQGLAGQASDRADMLRLLHALEPEHKHQFWKWLKTRDRLLSERLRRARQQLNIPGEVAHAG